MVEKVFLYFELIELQCFRMLCQILGRFFCVPYGRWLLAGVVGSTVDTWSSDREYGICY